jgi:outer membrane lipase/esterase
MIRKIRSRVHKQPLGSRSRPTLEALEDRALPSNGLVGNLVIFGDSLSDTGNSSLATGGALPNSALYYQGRYSNGPIWVDDLAKYLGEPAVQPSLAGGLDYAYGGATVAFEHPPPPINSFPRLSQQIDLYLAAHHPARNDLFVVWAGANDFFQAFASPWGPVNPIVSADTLVSTLQTLANAGARQIVVPNLPPLGETPFLRSLGLQAAADQWTAAFDIELATDVANFQAGNARATIVSVDVAGLFQQMVQPSNPFGFVNTTDPVGPLVPGSVFLASVTATDPQDYLFYDGAHPTSKTHQIIGIEATLELYDALVSHRMMATDTADPAASGLWQLDKATLVAALHGPGSDDGHGQENSATIQPAADIDSVLTTLSENGPNISASHAQATDAIFAAAGQVATDDGTWLSGSLNVLNVAVL